MTQMNQPDPNAMLDPAGQPLQGVDAQQTPADTAQQGQMGVPQQAAGAPQQTPTQQAPHQQVPAQGGQTLGAPQAQAAQPTAQQDPTAQPNLAPQNTQPGQNPQAGQNAQAAQSVQQNPQTGQVLGSGAPGQSGQIKDPEEWTTGDQPMTDSQRSYLDTLAKQAGETLPANLTKAQASEHIDRLQGLTGRAQQS